MEENQTFGHVITKPGGDFLRRCRIVASDSPQEGYVYINTSDDRRFWMNVLWVEPVEAFGDMFKDKQN